MIEETKKPANPPAFPARNRWDDGNQSHDLQNEGMDLRDYFAAKAMQAYILKADFPDKTLAEFSYQIADAMLIEREKP